MFTRKKRLFGPTIDPFQGRRRASLAVCLAVLIAALGAPAGALGDGDPASDVLLSQNVFFGYSAPSQTIQNELYSVTSAAARAGYPLRIALIDSKADLGAIPQYFGRPQIYARYLSYELSDVVQGQFLIVMPAGFGHAIDYKPLTVGPLSGITIGRGPNGLGAAAVTAAERLAAAAGHPLGSDAASQSIASGASGSSITQAFEILVVLFGLTAAALAGAVTARRRRQRRHATTA
jgi:hypothetical protein